MESVDLDLKEDYLREWKSFFTEIYSKEIDECSASFPKIKSLIIDYSKLQHFSPVLADELIRNPDMVLASASLAIKELNISTISEDIQFNPHIRIKNIPDENLFIENIGSKEIGELIYVKGVITKRGQILHKIKIASYKCTNCGAEYKIPVASNNSSAKPSIPKKCTACGYEKTLKLSEESSYFVDMQRAELQELLERVSGKNIAAKINLIFEDDLVNTISPGDEVGLVGILRLVPPQKYKSNPFIYHRYIDVLYIEKSKKDFEEIEITKDDLKKIEQLSQDPLIIDRIIDSIAPDIYGHREIKKAIALMLFGGTKDKYLESGGRIRNDIHILLMGDPGTAKSRFLERVLEIAPKSIFTSGQSTTGVGLTAAVEKDELSDGGFTLKAGALVLASGGVGCIDEFDKLSKEDIAALHEVMERQTVTITKAGIHATFRAKTSIIAAANPKRGRFDLNKNIIDQFNIVPTILSRFDLLFAIQDIIDEKRDSELADTILRSHKLSALRKKKKQASGYIETELLKKYIAYARKNIRPVLSEDAEEKIKQYYLELRQLGKESGAVAITPRQIEGLIRLSEAAAKMRLSNVVETKDCELATNLHKYVMEQIAKDRDTGQIDYDLIATGTSRSQVTKIERIREIMQELAKQDEKGLIDIKQVKQMAKQENISLDLVERAITELEREGELYRPRKPGFLKFTEED